MTLWGRKASLLCECICSMITYTCIVIFKLQSWSVLLAPMKFKENVDYLLKKIRIKWNRFDLSCLIQNIKTEKVKATLFPISLTQRWKQESFLRTSEVPLLANTRSQTIYEELGNPLSIVCDVIKNFCSTWNCQVPLWMWKIAETSLRRLVQWWKKNITWNNLGLWFQQVPYAAQ